MNELARNLLIWVIVAVVLMGVFQSFSQSSVRSDTVQYNEFVQMVRDDQVARVTIDDDRVTIHGERKDGSRSEEHTSELQSLMRISYAVFCLKKKKNKTKRKD